MYAYLRAGYGIEEKAVMVKYLLFYTSVVIAMAVVVDHATASGHLTETRYCGEPKRNADGSIKRNCYVVKAFEKLYPLPDGYDRDDWQADHVIPLALGGCDSVSNMQWLPKTIKTCVDDHCKDRFERGGIYPKGY